MNFYSKSEALREHPFVTKIKKLKYESEEEESCFVKSLLSNFIQKLNL